MISIRNTENLTGVSISGDSNDLYELVEAFYAVTINEESEKHQSYINISTRVLGLCYEIRHAMMGDREIELIDNGMHEENMKFHSLITPKSNVYYKVDYLYPEMFFIMMALNQLVKLRIMEFSKEKYLISEGMHKNVIWDDKIAIIRLFQAQFQKCVRELLTDASFKRWLTVMNEKYVCIQEIAGQYLDMLNIKYINMDREKRLKNLSKIAKRIGEFDSDEEHNDIKEVISIAAKEYGCSEDEIQLVGMDYPENIAW